jgi:hypothetical protein
MIYASGPVQTPATHERLFVRPPIAGQSAL